MHSAAVANGHKKPAPGSVLVVWVLCVVPEACARGANRAYLAAITRTISRHLFE